MTTGINGLDIKYTMNARKAAVQNQQETEEQPDFKSMFLDCKANLEQKILNGETETKIQLGAQEFTDKEWAKLIKNVDMAIQRDDNSSIVEELKDPEHECPYNAFAKDGIIEHSGVVFSCDYEHNMITLGNMGDPDQSKILNIKLPSGGYIRIHEDNFGDILKCVDFFSPEDLNAIMEAIQKYKYCKNKQGQLDDAMEQDFINLSPNQKVNDNIF